MSTDLPPSLQMSEEFGRHTCCVYESEEQLQAVLASLICSGIKADEKALCVLEPGIADSILTQLRESGFNTDPWIESGQLEFLTSDNTYLEGGGFCSKSMLDRLQAEIARALHDGYRALRIAGNMTWALHGTPIHGELVEYETRVNILLEEKPCSALCLYDQRAFPPALLLDVLGAHPTVMIGIEKHNNFFYIPPAQLSTQLQPETIFKQRLQNLIERDREIVLYQALVKNSVQGWVILDSCFNIVFANPAFAEITGYAIEELLSFNPTQVRALIHPEDQPLVWGRFKDHLQGKSVPPKYVFQVMRKDGDTQWLEMSVSRIDYAGRPALQGAVLSLTDQHHAEEASKESELFSSSIIAHSPDGIVLTDERGCVITWNAGAERIMGLKREDVIGRPLWEVQYEITASEIRSEELKQFLESIVMDMLLTGEESSLSGEMMEIEIERPDGSRLDIQHGGFIIPTETGFQVAAIIRDISEFKRASTALRDSEELYRTLLKTSPDAVVVMDLNGLITQVSDQAVKLSGALSADELIGMNSQDLLIKKDRQRASEFFQRTLEEGLMRGIQFRYLHRDGTEHYGEMNASLLKDIDGNPTSFIATVRDVSPRIEAEKKLRESEERYRALVEDMPALICRFLPDGTLTFVNEHFSRYFNIEKKMLIGQDFFQFIPEEERERVRAHYASLTPADSVIAIEHKVWPSDGIARWQRWIDRALFDADERAIEYQSIGEDITDQKQAEVEIREANQRLQETLAELKTTQQKVISQERLAAIGQLAAGIAHDFSNTLMPITLYSDLLRRELDLSPKHKARMDIIFQQAQRATGFTQQILDFSRQSLMQFRSIELQPSLEKTIDLLRRTLPENIEIHLAYGPEEYRINGDLRRIEQALTNLGVNACNEMPDGGKLLFELSRTHFGPEQMPPIPEMHQGVWICIAVQDTGDGIPPDKLSHIFEPFFSNGETSSGNGLNLAQVYGIIKQHKGFINVTSQVGEGTRFDLYIPASTHEVPERIIYPSEIIPTDSIQVLVVEDDDGTRQALCEILEALNYQVITASTGVEAVKLYEENEIDLVVSDLVMPEMGGAALFSALRKHDPDVRLILMTGYPLDEIGRDLIEQGITAWLYKPFNIEEISQTIRSALGSKSQ